MSEPTSLSVHRCRFVDFVPSAITAIAFPPFPLPKLKGAKIAGSSRTRKFGSLVVGRANGNIEIFEWSGAEYDNQAPQGWIVRKILPGPSPSKVDALTLALRDPDSLPRGSAPTLQDLRLFSAGGGSELVEWDLERGCVFRTIDSQGGAIWSVSANPASNILALGCEDGCVRLLSLENNTLAHSRRFDRIKSRLLSIAWGPPVPRHPSASQTPASSSDTDDDEADWSDSWLVTGGSDSSIRKWDVTTGRAIERMTTDRLRGERTLVWAVSVLGDGTIISGDSLGMVKFWDSRTGTQTQSFQAHGADVLCLAIGADGNAVFSSGVDQKICLFTLIKVSNPEKSSLLRISSRWVQSTAKRMHSHDVRSLAVWPTYLPVPPQYQVPFAPGLAPLLASGGLDMSVVITPCSPASGTLKLVNPLGTNPICTFEDAFHRRLPYTNGISPALHLARKAQLVLCMRDTTVTLWRFLNNGRMSEPLIAQADVAKEGGYEKVLDMEFKTSTNLLSSAISDDGAWLAVSDFYEVKLYQLHAVDGELRPKRVKDFGNALQTHLPKLSAPMGASALGFSPDSTKFILATSISSHVLVIDLGANEQKPRVLRKFDQHRSRQSVSGDRAVKNKPATEDINMEGADEEDVTEAQEEEPLLVVILRMAFSPDGQWLATTDDHCRTHVYNMDAVQHHCLVPSMPQPVHALAFDPASPATLVFGLGNNRIEIFDVEARRFPDWSRELCGSLPQRFTHLHDPILGVAFAPAVVVDTSASAPHRYALFWGGTWMCKVRLNAPAGWGGISKKRRRHSNARTRPQTVAAGDDTEDSNFKLVTRYRPILFVDYLASGELVVVERPLLDVLATLPPAFFKPKYGS